MRVNQPSRTRLHRSFRGEKLRFSRRMQAAVIGIGAMVLTIAPIVPLRAWGQTPTIPGINAATEVDSSPAEPSAPLGRYFDRAIWNSDIATGEVHLDGNELFTIAVPTDEDDSNDSPLIEQRVEGIENTLNSIIEEGVDPETLEVTTTLDPDSRLPVISVGDQYLMTVTTLDAQLQGTDPERWSNELTQIIEGALVRARRQRQPQFLVRQGVIASGIFVGMLVLSQVITMGQQRLKNKQKQIEAEMPDDPSKAADPNASEETTSATVHARLVKQQQRNVNDIKRRILQLAQFGVWSGGIFIILGLFPYTRWLQPLVLSTPLQLIGVGAATYVSMRISEVAIDRFFGVVQANQLVTPEASERLALRVTTFSRVLKSAMAILWISGGVLVALAVVGVNLLPLLAGAGIIGLAISFAAQSVVKDVINGFFILLEDQYAVGDVIRVNDVSGLVENMNLRITQLRDNEGQLITVPNSAITTVRNLSKDWSRVDLAIQVAYGTDPDRALEVLKELAMGMYHDPYWRTKLPEPPEVLGIDEIQHTGLLIRIWFKTKPLQQWVVAREFRRRLRQAMEKEGLAIGAPQQFLNFKDALVLRDQDPTAPHYSQEQPPQAQYPQEQQSEMK